MSKEYYKIEKKDFQKLSEIMANLENLMTERISDLYNVEGSMATRHSFLLYRRMVWDARNLMRDNLKQLKPKSNEETS